MLEIKEEWRTIEKFEGSYEVSNLGNVRSLDRVVDCLNRGTYPSKRRLKGAPMKLIFNKRYYQVELKKDGYNERPLVHRLVAIAFIPNPKTLPTVNHIDGNRLNNRIDNLEWCTYAENVQHAHRTGLASMKHISKYSYKKGRVSQNRMPVIDLNTGIFYESGTEAALLLGYNRRNLTSYLNGSRPNKTSLRYA